MEIMNTSREPLVSFRASPEWKNRVKEAAEVRDGGVVTRFIKRAVDELIERESLLSESSTTSDRLAS